MLCRLFGSVLGFCPLDAKSTSYAHPHVGRPYVFPDVAKCLLVGRIALVENHCFRRKGMPGKQRVALNLLGLELLFKCLVY